MFERFYNNAARKGFHFPGRLIAGDGALSDAIKASAAPHVLIIDAALCERELPVPRDTLRIPVTREPLRDDALAAAEKAAAVSPQTIIALGGGSTIDVAKAVVMPLRHGTLDARDAPRSFKAPLLVAASSLPGAGSETSRFFILSDPATGHKISQRSFDVVPDVTVLDPHLLEGASATRLLAGAFDAFMHLWETFICRHERSPATDMLALHHMPLLMRAAETLSRNVRPDQSVLMELLYASAYGGIAISNVRTGLVHTLGESLAAQIALPHPLTLLAFFSAGLSSYRDAIGDRLALLLPHLNAQLPERAPWSLDALIAHWQEVLTRTGLYERVRHALSRGIDIDTLLIAAARDSVLTKENPVPVTPQSLTAIVRSSLASFAAPVSRAPFTRE